MQLGLIGLGKMGGNMAERLKLAGHQVVGFDSNADAVARLGAPVALDVRAPAFPVPRAQSSTRP